MQIETVGELSLLRFHNLSGISGLIHGVTTRLGGVSTGEYATLNLGLHVGDNPAHVLENRRRACEALGIRSGSLVVGAQVHGGLVEILSRDHIGRGAYDAADAIAGVDALVTAEKQVPLMALSADCPLVLLFDPAAHVAAVAHAGWRSLAAGILGRTVTAMESLGAAAGRLQAGVAPCVGNCCYEIGRDFIDKMGESINDAENYMRRNGQSLFFDLRAAVAGELVRTGLRSENIEIAEDCTSCSEREFFSYRAAAGITGRFAALIQMES